MGTQQRLALGLWTSGIALWSALFPLPAAAQYGGQPSRTIFSAPADAHKVPASSRAQTADAYDPNVWLAQRSSRGRSTVAYAGSPAPQMVSHDASELIPTPMPAHSAHGVEYEIGHEMHHHDCTSCGQGDCTASECGDCGEHARCVPCRRTTINHLQIFAGPHGFKGPRDFGSNGNFGFQEGFNVSGPFGFLQCYDVGYQVGFQTTQSNLSGTQYRDEARIQYFITAGLFSRKPVGLQWGVVWDYYHDDYDIFGVESTIELNQVRGLLSIKNVRGDEIGFMGSVGTDDTDDVFSLAWMPVDQYMLFYKWQLEMGAEARIFGGLSGEADGLLGADAFVPLNDRLSLGLSWNYLIPEEGNSPLGAASEQWNLAVNLTWHWRCDARTTTCSPYRPMFNVANNGSFFVRQK